MEEKTQEQKQDNTAVKTEAKPVAPAAPAAAPAANDNRPAGRSFGGQRGGGGFQQRARFGQRFGGDRRGGRDGGRERKDEFDSKLLDLARVSHTRAGGRRLRFRAIVVSGNKTGKVGMGIASGVDVAQAVEKATYQSKKNMIIVPIVNDTIGREILAKVGPAKVLLKPQQKGRGLIAGGVVRLICQLAGIKNISSKLLGTTKNKLNNARATISAFKKLQKLAGANKAVIAPKTEVKAKN